MYNLPACFSSEISLEADMQENRVKANQIELQVREYGHEGDAIIFLHFSGANLMMWQRIIPDFRNHYRLILRLFALLVFLML